MKNLQSLRMTTPEVSVRMTVDPIQDWLNAVTFEGHEVVDAIKKLGGFEDAHTGASFKPVGSESPWQLVYYRGKVSVLKRGTACCLNPIELRDGVPTLSVWSYGGTIDSTTRSLEDAIAAFNESPDWDKVREHHVSIIRL